MQRGQLGSRLAVGHECHLHARVLPAQPLTAARELAERAARFCKTKCKAAGKARCDQAGYYYNYADTVPYRESRYARSGDYDYRYYSRNRCRLAPAPVDATGDVRYVRVCPDGYGQYRIVD